MTHSFFGGVYPATRKDMTRRKPLSRLSRTPKEIVIPLIMCADGPSTPMVGPGDSVLVGQPIARRGQTGAAAFASVSGRVAAVEDRPHPWGGHSPAIVIQNDERNEHYEGRPAPLDPRQLTLEQLVERVEWAGVVGMGGGAFPTWEKIAAAFGKVDTLIVSTSSGEPRPSPAACAASGWWLLPRGTSSTLWRRWSAGCAGRATAGCRLSRCAPAIPWGRRSRLFRP